MWIQPKLELQPSEYFQRQGAATFCDDEVGLHNRNVTGVECLLWGNDYPHFEGGRNPLGRFSRSLDGHPDISLDRFYSENFSRVFSV